MPRLRQVVPASERERRTGHERLVRFRGGEQQPHDRREEEDSKDRQNPEAHAPCDRPPHSSLLNNPLRVTTSTAAANPITRRSTEIAAARLKSPYLNATW